MSETTSDTRDPSPSPIVLPFRGHEPRLASGVFVAPGAVVVGAATLGAGASVWYGTVVRADIAPIEVGEGTNLQDLSLLHVGDDFPCIVGARCVVGHRVILHGCRIGNECMIGMGAILMNGVVVGSRSIVASGSLLTEKTVVPPNSLVMGSPAKVIRSVRPDEVERTIHLAEKYRRVAAEHAAQIVLAGGSAGPASEAGGAR